MVDLKKLKAVLATELELREVYQGAFDLVKDAESLEKHIDSMGKEAAEVENSLEKLKEREKKALDAALAAEKVHYERVIELEGIINQDRIDASKNIEEMMATAKGDVDRLKAEKVALEKQIKDLGVRVLTANSDVEAAEGKLAEIRAKLASI